jgi:glucose-6-phosphate isomerase
MLSYSQAFEGFNQWYRQLWAESLGKKGKGFLPVTGLGPADQHSQLQLYLDGPRDKCFTILSQRQLTREKLRPELWKDFPELNFLAYSSMEDLLLAEKNATVQVLAERGCPVRTLSVSKLNEVSLGGLFAHFILETLLMGELLGIDPLTQPAVDAGKALAKRFLLNPGLLSQNLKLDKKPEDH